MPATQPNVFDLISSILTSDKFIAAFLGLIGGIIATFIAPWTKWIFEKKKIQIENRKEKVKHWRDEINYHNSFISFSRTSTFQELKSRFTKEELSEFCNIGTDTIPDISRDKVKLARFHDVAFQIEKEWGII